MKPGPLDYAQMRTEVLMEVQTWRMDYVKCVLDLPRGLWQDYYDALRRTVGGGKQGPEFEKHHKVTAWYNQSPDRETTCIEIWGEWAQVIRKMPFDVWGPSIKRIDVRGIAWDVSGDTVLALGQRLQRTTSSYNIETFRSKPASKRLGRDRGGEGFRVGSRKSDLCAVVYKRAKEPTAIEYRLQGQRLRVALEQTERSVKGYEDVMDRWTCLADHVQSYGNTRLKGVFRASGIEGYWDNWNEATIDDYLPSQMTLSEKLKVLDAEDHDPSHWDFDEYVEEAAERYRTTGDII